MDWIPLFVNEQGCEAVKRAVDRTGCDIKNYTSKEKLLQRGAGRYTITQDIVTEKHVDRPLDPVFEFHVYRIEKKLKRLSSFKK